MLVHQYTRLGSIRDRALRAAFRLKAIDAMTTRNDGVSVDMSRSRGRSASVPALFTSWLLNHEPRVSLNSIPEMEVIIITSGSGWRLRQLWLMSLSLFDVLLFFFT